MKIRIGCDPGKKGGIVAIYDDGTIKMERTPLTKNEIDITKFRNIILEYIGGIDANGNFENDVLVLVEDVHSIFGSGAKSNFEFGRALGILEAIICTLDIPFVKVNPKKWQDFCFQGVPKQYKAATIKTNKKGEQYESSPNDTKAMALLSCKRLFPKISFIPQGCRVEHNGLVDSALMAYYLKNRY